MVFFFNVNGLQNFFWSLNSNFNHFNYKFYVFLIKISESLEKKWIQIGIPPKRHEWLVAHHFDIIILHQSQRNHKVSIFLSQNYVYPHENSILFFLDTVIDNIFQHDSAWGKHLFLSIKQEVFRHIYIQLGFFYDLNGFANNLCCSYHRNISLFVTNIQCQQWYNELTWSLLWILWPFFTILSWWMFSSSVWTSCWNMYANINGMCSMS